MSIVFGALDTGTLLHGTIKPTAWEYTRTVQSFFGVTGEYHLQGRLHGRDQTAWLMLSGYASHVLLHDAIEMMNALSGTSGSVVWTSGADIKTFDNSVFNGFELDEDPWLDASGVNSWMVQGTLKFRQIKQ